MDSPPEELDERAPERRAPLDVDGFTSADEAGGPHTGNSPEEGSTASSRPSLLDGIVSGARGVNPWRLATGVVAGLCSFLVFYVLTRGSGPGSTSGILGENNVFRDTLAAGGDMGAHVWGPRFLKEELLPHFQLSGWSKDWYAGFPAYQFYMVVPALFIVMLDVGLPLVIGLPLLAALIAGLVVYWPAIRTRWAKALVLVGALVVGPLLIDLPYNVAFKVVAVAGVVALPITAALFGRLLRAPDPVPLLFAVAATFFVFDGSFTIYGGNAASTLAGEFSFALSLNFALLFMGYTVRGVENGRHRAIAAVLLALTATCHVIPLFFAMGGVAVAFALRPGRTGLKWLAQVLPLGGLLSSFWTVPFVLRSAYLNDMGWEKLVGGEIGKNLLSNRTPYNEVIIGLAVVGAVLSLIRWNRAGLYLTISALGSALVFRYMPQARFWNARILPFYYLCLYLLAAVGVAALLRLLSEGLVDARHPRRSLRGLQLAVGGVGGVVFVAAFLTNLGGSPDSWVNPLDLVPWLIGPLLDGWMLALLMGVLALEGILWGLAQRGPSRESLRRTVLGMGLGGVLATAMFMLIVPMGLVGRSISVPGPTFSEGATAPQLSGNQFGPFQATSGNVVQGWADWNFGGYEDKAAWPEFEQLMSTMGRVGEEHGCGRAMWEYFEKIGDYGTPMAPMLLPTFTRGCVGSMEGLYFEASMSTPFHFLNQSEISKGPSRPMRDMPYRDLDVAAGVEHLRLYGVRYLMLKSTEAVKQARDVPGLDEVATVPSNLVLNKDDKDPAAPWVVFQISDSALVEGLDSQPAVMTDVGPGHDSWLEPTIYWYQNPASQKVFLAADGPSAWPRISCGKRKVPRGPGHPYGEFPCAETPPVRPVPPVEVSEIEEGQQSISFDVDRVGTPVLVKASYFPNWEVEGAEGPWRVSPNLMVVVPTSRHVTMNFGTTWVEWLARLLTLAGLAWLGWLVLRPRPEPEPVWHFPYDAVPAPEGEGVDDGVSVSSPADPGETWPSLAPYRDEDPWDPEDSAADPVRSGGPGLDPAAEGSGGPEAR